MGTLNINWTGLYFSGGCGGDACKVHNVSLRVCLHFVNGDHDELTSGSFGCCAEHYC